MVFKVLKKRNFRYFFAADIVSNIGSAMSFIGFNWYIFEQTGSNTAVGILLSLSILAGFVVFPVAGTMADRLNRKGIIIWANLIRGFIILLLLLYYSISGSLPIGYIYLLAAIGGAGWSIVLPCSRAMVQEILDKDELIHGNSLIEISLQLSSFTAAALAGIIYRYFGLSAILLLDAITYFAGTAFILLMRYRPALKPAKVQSFSRDFSDGIRYLWNQRLILALGIISILPFVATITSNVVLPGYVKDHLAKDSVVFGLADMAYGIGAFISGFIAAGLVKRMKRFKALLLFFLLSIGALLFLSANTYVFGLYLGNIFFGLSNSSLRIVFNTTLMEIVPKKFFGRSMSVWLACSYVFQVISTYLVGKIMDWISIPTGFLSLVIIMLIALWGAVSVLLGMKRRNLIDSF